ncbi:response regulator transcription factor [Geotalea sp. SG265]|uniref:response regulator n=1 Tax=Geotalea sp. SG265 TaxID=2922867 RepID=UPI001FAF2E88|nr:response regulator transcription factor [Geotalea sp. SG265]
MFKVAICDDHAIVRKGVREILIETSDILVVGEAGNWLELLTLLHDNEVDLVLLDISMPDRNGLDILKQLRHEYPEVRVLMLSMYPEEQYAIRALKAGASGYLTKDSALDELVKAVRRVSGGGKYVSSALSEKLIAEFGESRDALPHELLSDREFQVLTMIASGKSSADMAHELSISVKTVSTYRSRITEKMRLKNDAEITAYALKHDIVK